MKKRRRRWLIVIPIGFLALCLLAVMAIAFSNRFLPEQSTVVERLSAEEKARLAEAFHLRRSLGDDVWPGWGEAEIPLVVFNEAYVFLVGYQGEPPAGWRKVPQGTLTGDAWEPVPGDTFQGESYYRQPLPASGETPQAFTVRVGATWAASLQTKEWMEIALADQFREDLPGFLRPIFPYRVVVRLFLGGTDKYVTALLHESFHAYQGQVAGERLAATEGALGRHEAAYPWQDEVLEEMWQTELDLLRDALQADNEAQQSRLVQQFLDQREERREVAKLSAQLVGYEQEREWEEGLAKYVEMESWRQGAETAGYQSDPAAETLDDFEGYETFRRAWNREVDQIARMAGDEGDGRFYYSGMAQANLLDSLRPGWKEFALTTDLSLEELLAGKEPAATASAAEPATTPGATAEQVVEVYFGNSRLNPEADCSAVFAVTRTVPADVHPTAAALDALFSGPTASEESGDYHSWFSEETANALLGLNTASDGTAYVNLADLRRVIPNASTSCGSQQFFAEVETTLRAADPDIGRVIYAIEGDPRPFYEWMQIGCTPENDNCDPAPFRN